ncbi:MAG TPA: hypothetical protein VLA90_02780 [Actinomycetota bacterium]|nr:hypothetical protein [Actinomycetota bacterium]
MNESKLSDRLHHLASEMPVDLERSAPPTLRRARVRRGAAVLLSSAAVIALAVGGVAMLRVAAPLVSDDPNPEVPLTEGPAPVVPSDPPFAGLWPETTPHALAEVQAAVDDGHQPWRLDATTTAQALSAGLFGWDPDEFMWVERHVRGAQAEVRIVSRLFADPVPPIDIRLAKLGESGPTGIWSVVGVTSPLIEIDAVELRMLTDPVAQEIAPGALRISGRVSDLFEGATFLEASVLAGPTLESSIGGATLDLESGRLTELDGAGRRFRFGAYVQATPTGRAILLLKVPDANGASLGSVMVSVEVPAGEPASPPSPDFTDLPPDVAVTVQRIFDAAGARDVDELAELVDLERFSYNFGVSDDPVAAWREDRSVLEPITAILSLPSIVEEIDGTTYHVWPYLMADGTLEEISEQERADLHALGLSDDHITEMQSFGGYLGPRLGIDETGAWRYYVTGGD